MKTIGLIGGMSWESTQIYYQILNTKIKELQGGFSSCQCLIYSVNFKHIATLQHQGNWQALNKEMAQAALNLYNGGAEIIILCTNSMHLCADAIKEAVPIPFIHIAEVTGQAIASKKINTIALLGTKFTMEKTFYTSILNEKFDIQSIIPKKQDREKVHNIIYNELVKGQIVEESRQYFVNLIHNLAQEGAEGIVLGCTEIPLLISSKDVNIPLFNTTKIHAESAVDFALDR